MDADAARCTYFVPVRTQFENLGDVAINAGMVRFLRGLGPVRIERRKLPNSLTELYGTNDAELRGRLRWWGELIGVMGRKRGTSRVLVLKPGGLVAPRSAAERLGFLTRVCLVAVARLTGADVVQFCHSAGSLPPVWRGLERWKTRILTVSMPRDQATVDANGLRCEPVPDALLLADDVTPPTRRTRNERFRLVVSLRDGPRISPASAPALAKSVRDTARRLGLVAGVVTQVGRDDELNGSIAHGLDVTPLARWDQRRPESRRAVFDAYDEAEVVISNRLHVLLIAARRGAHCVAVVDDHRSKIPGALCSSGVGFATVTSADLFDACALAPRLVQQIGAGPDRGNEIRPKGEEKMRRAECELRWRLTGALVRTTDEGGGRDVT